MAPHKQSSTDQEFKGLFLYETKSKQNDCFVYPASEGRCIFNTKQVIGSVAEPKRQRRDVLKFAVNASQWK